MFLILVVGFITKIEEIKLNLQHNLLTQKWVNLLSITKKLIVLSKDM